MRDTNHTIQPLQYTWLPDLLPEKPDPMENKGSEKDFTNPALPSDILNTGTLYKNMVEPQERSGRESFPGSTSRDTNHCRNRRALDRKPACIPEPWNRNEL